MCEIRICSKCGKECDDQEPMQNGKCIDCFAEDWGEIVEISPMVSPKIEKAGE